MDKDPSERLRRAIKENNLFLVRRLLGRADIRNPDPGPGRYTSLAWAAVCAHEEIYDYILGCGHDDDELSRDADNNTILILLAGLPPPHLNPNHRPCPGDTLSGGSALRMARTYYERFPFLIDWSNVEGKTALHVAALKGNEEFVRMFCDLEADFDLPDVEGNTPLHYASAWGHVAVVQLLIERGCQFAAKNNDGFTASDYAYSNATMQTLQETARLQFENNKRARRNIYAQAASRGNEMRIRSEQEESHHEETKLTSIVLNRLRSGSGTTSTSESNTDYETSSASLSSIQRPANRPHQSSMSSSNSSAMRSNGENQTSSHTSSPAQPLASRTGSAIPPTTSRTIQPPNFPTASQTQAQKAPGLSPIANRMRKRDADAMAQYMSRNVSGMSDIGSPSTNGLSSVEQNITPQSSRILRPSASAAVLREASSLSSLKAYHTPPAPFVIPPRRDRSTTLDTIPPSSPPHKQTLSDAPDATIRGRPRDGRGHPTDLWASGTIPRRL